MTRLIKICFVMLISMAMINAYADTCPDLSNQETNTLPSAVGKNWSVINGSLGSPRSFRKALIVTLNSYGEKVVRCYYQNDDVKDLTVQLQTKQLKQRYIQPPKKNWGKMNDKTKVCTKSREKCIFGS